MKTISILISVLLTAALLTGCGTLSINPNAKIVTPSNNIITETRDVIGFSGINISTIGTVNVTQGDKEALTIKGSDNLVALVKTQVSNGVLVIRMDNVNIQSMKTDDVLTFDITVKDLNSLDISGLATVEMSGLETGSLDLAMSGAGAMKLSKLTADSVSVDVSGLGGITLTGTADSLDVKISGAGEVMAADLEVKTASASLSGLGTATINVSEQLTGDISGAGSVRYYGQPKVSANSSGLGQFEALGSK